MEHSIKETPEVAGDYPGTNAVVWLTYFSFLLVPLLLYTLRFLDDNKLVSWSWGVSLQQFLLMFAVISLVLLVAVFLSRLEIKHQHNVSLIVMLSFLMLIPFWSLPESIIDNARYFTQAKYASLYGLAYYVTNWGGPIFSWTDLPMVPLLYGMLFKLFGETRSTIQVATALFFSGTVLVTYLTGKQLWSEFHGLLAALLLLGMPYIYSQTPLLLVDVPTMFFVTLAVYLTVLAVNRSSYSLILSAAIVITIALLSKYSVWLFLSVLPLALFACSSHGWRDAARRLCLLGGLVMTFIGIVFLYKHDVFLQQFNILFDYQLNALGGWKESNVSTFLFQVHPFVFLAAIVSVYLAINRQDKKFIIISWMVLLVFLLQIERSRYLMPVFPMLALMAAYALASIRCQRLGKFIGYGVALSSYVMALVIGLSFLPTMSADNIRQAGSYLDSTDMHGVDVIVLPQLRSMVNPELSIAALDYHTQKTVFYRRLDGLTAPVNAHKSSVRFSWDFTVPEYYLSDNRRYKLKNAIALVYSHRSQLESEVLKRSLTGYRLVEEFNSYSPVFKYKTLVNVYMPV